jgi:hypothetical protein
MLIMLLLDLLLSQSQAALTGASIGTTIDEIFNTFAVAAGETQ